MLLPLKVASSLFSESPDEKKEKQQTADDSTSLSKSQSQQFISSSLWLFHFFVCLASNSSGYWIGMLFEHLLSIGKAILLPGCNNFCEQFDPSDETEQQQILVRDLIRSTSVAKLTPPCNRGGARFQSPADFLQADPFGDVQDLADKFSFDALGDESLAHVLSHILLIPSLLPDYRLIVFHKLSSYLSLMKPLKEFERHFFSAQGRFDWPSDSPEDKTKFLYILTREELMSPIVQDLESLVPFSSVVRRFYQKQTDERLASPFLVSYCLHHLCGFFFGDFPGVEPLAFLQDRYSQQIILFNSIPISLWKECIAKYWSEGGQLIKEDVFSKRIALVLDFERKVGISKE